ncbi:MAG: hypothetical protein BA865_00335 [Desulfobacterales bacterium S5133MH4]|nr:MAG: hypothetical protein BA865_00335 [Desulfobacterales bacterium S5133MH4]
MPGFSLSLYHLHTTHSLGDLFPGFASSTRRTKPPERLATGAYAGIGSRREAIFLATRLGTMTSMVPGNGGPRFQILDLTHRLPFDTHIQLAKNKKNNLLSLCG